MTSDPVAPGAVVMLQRMHARAVDCENRGDAPRIGSDEVLAVLRAIHAERDRHAEEVAMLEERCQSREEQLGKLSELYDVTQERLEDFEEREPDARLCAEWAATVALKATDVYSAARRYLCGEGIVAQVQQENDSLRDRLRKVTAERDRERERATKMEAELADRRAHDEDVRTCLEYCDEDDPTPGGIGGLARELLEWFSGRVA